MKKAQSDANELRAEVNRWVSGLATFKFPLALSIGYADNVTGVETLPEFFARADKRLYEQKKLKAG